MESLRERLLGRFRPRSASLRLWLSLSYGLLAVVLVAIVSRMDFAIGLVYSCAFFMRLA